MDLVIVALIVSNCYFITSKSDITLYKTYHDINLANSS